MLSRIKVSSHEPITSLLYINMSLINRLGCWIIFLLGWAARLILVGCARKSSTLLLNSAHFELSWPSCLCTNHRTRSFWPSWWKFRKCWPSCSCLCAALFWLRCKGRWPRSQLFLKWRRSEKLSNRKTCSILRLERSTCNGGALF